MQRIDAASWMGDGADWWRDRTILDMVLPGAHDAATGYMPSVPVRLSTQLLGLSLGTAWMAPLLRWAGQTQHAGLERLLECGVRCFDVRVQADVPVCVQHGEARIEKPLADIVTGVVHFFNTRPRSSREIAILYLSHFQARSALDADSLLRVYHALFSNTGLAERALPFEALRLSLDETWARFPGRNVYVVVDEPGLFDLFSSSNLAHADCVLPAGRVYISPYLSPSMSVIDREGPRCTLSAQQSVAQSWLDIEKRYLGCYGPHLDAPQCLKVLQTHLQVDQNFLLWSAVPFWGHDIETGAAEVNKQLAKWLLRIPPTYRVNIVEVDFYPVHADSHLFRAFVAANIRTRERAELDNWVQAGRLQFDHWKASTKWTIIVTVVVVTIYLVYRVVIF